MYHAVIFVLVHWTTGKIGGVFYEILSRNYQQRLVLFYNEDSSTRILDRTVRYFDGSLGVHHLYNLYLYNLYRRVRMFWLMVLRSQMWPYRYH